MPKIIEYVDTHLRCPQCKRPIQQGIMEYKKKDDTFINQYYSRSVKCPTVWCNYTQRSKHRQAILADLDDLGFTGGCRPMLT